MVLICACGYTGRHAVDPVLCPRCGSPSASRPADEDPLVHVAQDGTRFNMLMADVPREIAAVFARLLYWPPEGHGTERVTTAACEFAHGPWWVRLGSIEISTITPPEQADPAADLGELLDELEDMPEVARTERRAGSPPAVAQLDLRRAVQERMQKIAELVDECRALVQADQWRPGDPLPPRRPRPADDF